MTSTRPVRLLAAAALGIALTAACTSPSASDPSASGSSPGKPSSATGQWALTASPAQAVHNAGLALLTAEGSVAHYHAHLAVWVDGTEVPVPAGIGIDPATRTLSALHTHDTSGILHVESPSATDTFTLGQALTEWGVAGPAGCIAGICPAHGSTWHILVDGSEVPGGDPSSIRLAPHQQIVLAYAQHVAPGDYPATYTFPPGD